MPIGEVTLITKCYREYMELAGVQKDLDQYLHRLEEAEKRDHRKLGKEMDLFHFRESPDLLGMKKVDAFPKTS